jgi:hypothetical protein
MQRRVVLSTLGIALTRAVAGGAAAGATLGALAGINKTSKDAQKKPPIHNQGHVRRGVLFGAAMGGIISAAHALSSSEPEPTSEPSNTTDTNPQASPQDP